MIRARLALPCAALATTCALLALPACSGVERGGRGLGSAPAARSEPADTSDLPDSLTDQSLDWSRCEAPDASQGDEQMSPSPLPDGTEWECATMRAPVDYRSPEGDTLDIALIRSEAHERGDDRIGSLIFNFGGPGGSGVLTLPAFGQDYRDLHRRYDLVSFDPRGVGDSEGVNCLDPEGLDRYFAADPVPENAKERRRLNDRLREFAQGCEESAGDLLPHLTTEATARDMDLLRRVLGDRELHYFGVSYGTELGAVYAHLFPRRVGRAVFDAVVDPTGTTEQGALAQTKGFQLALDTYIDRCAESENCPLGDDEDEAEDRLTDLLHRLRERPLRTQDPDDRRLTESLAWGGIAQSLYSEDFWPYLTQGLDDALSDERPDGTVLLALGDAMNGRNPDGTYSTLQSSLTAISCADSSERYTDADVRRVRDAFDDASAVFGPAMAWSLLNCTHWPVRGDRPHPEVGAEGADTMLLIGTTGDPATPFQGTEHMQKALGGEDVAVTLTFDGEGHGAYTSGNDCVVDKTNAYLLRGDLPDNGDTCD
ncbi:alpha/beta hydrolase [Streptomyces radicis]|uniref:Alpha/beta hydrolase n=1 Tax=Streptomyces radicis TaxID=1750517 RepID=A0A3A9WHU2_9ACTN|nr:alpha/beta hydrolase [Streptomyces radicis]RKN09014.1 alpha/beta hydrolase [Streptomyces radicis]RKN22795.1 alpha/beta hydrolase [Streptomyces radicis]